MDLNLNNLKKNDYQVVCFEAPSNIALIKYWGKKNNQQPINPSISYTLSGCKTTFQVFFREKKEDLPVRKFFFDGKEANDFSKKSSALIEKISSDYPILRSLDLVLNSKNTFPHSSGIASSASSMCALSLCLLKIVGVEDKEIISNYSRQGSGSASRSIYGGLVSWGESEVIKNSSDNFASSLSGEIPKSMLDIGDAVILIDEGVKKVSSSLGHSLMNDHSHRESRIYNAKRRYEKLIEAMKESDFSSWGEIIEQEALELHAMMMTSETPYILIKPGTLNVIEKVQNFRWKKSVPIYFTLDAGPNVHLLYPLSYEKEVLSFIKSELSEYDKNKKIIFDRVGVGPKELMGLSL